MHPDSVSAYTSEGEPFNRTEKMISSRQHASGTFLKVLKMAEQLYGRTALNRPWE